MAPITLFKYVTGIVQRSKLCIYFFTVEIFTSDLNWPFVELLVLLYIPLWHTVPYVSAKNDIVRSSDGDHHDGSVLCVMYERGVVVTETAAEADKRASVWPHICSPNVNST